MESLIQYECIRPWSIWCFFFLFFLSLFILGLNFHFGWLKSNKTLLQSDENFIVLGMWFVCARKHEILWILQTILNIANIKCFFLLNFWTNFDFASHDWISLVVCRLSLNQMIIIQFLFRQCQIDVLKSFCLLSFNNSIPHHVCASAYTIHHRKNLKFQTKIGCVRRVTTSLKLIDFCYFLKLSY